MEAMNFYYINYSDRHLCRRKRLPFVVLASLQEEVLPKTAALDFFGSHLHSCWGCKDCCMAYCIS